MDRLRNCDWPRRPKLIPDREATIVAIGLHPFVVGTPNGAEALRRVLENFKNQKLVWVTDVEAVMDVAGREEIAERDQIASALPCGRNV